MSNTTTLEAPSAQAITGWKGKADKLISLEAELSAAQAKLEAKLKPIREQFEPDIEAKKKEVAKLKSEVVNFGTDHADVLFAEGSEIKTKVAIITGRNTPGAVTVSDGFDEVEVIQTLNADRTLKGYVDVKYSLAKATIKKCFTNHGPHIAALNAAGVELTEGFSVNVKSKGD
jgi:phage host-nuclease inhibitor protein Gam